MNATGVFVFATPPWPRNVADNLTARGAAWGMCARCVCVCVENGRTMLLAVPWFGGVWVVLLEVADPCFVL